MKLRVGLIGIGQDWDNRHRQALRALSDRFEVRAVCDEVAHRAEHVAREFQATPVDGFRALTERGDIDAVMLLANPWYGPLPITAACASGKAIYCATAFNLEVSEARDLRRAVDHAGVAFMAEFPRRLYPATQRLKELIATKLGAPRLLFCHHRSMAHVPNEPSAENQTTRVTRAMLELVDWCCYVVGCSPNSVAGVEHRDQDGAEVDYQMMSLDFSSDGQHGSGPMAQISYGRYLSPAWPESITFRAPSGLQVCCERGVAFVDPPSSLVWFDDAGRHLESLDSERPVGEQLLSLFHRSVTSLVRKSSDLEDAYRSLYVTLMLQRGISEGRRITLNGCEDGELR